MKDFGSGTIRDCRGRWQLLLPYMEDGVQRTVTKVTDIPSTGGRGRRKAAEALRRWRDEQIRQDVTEYVSGVYEARIAAMTSNASEGADMSALSKPVSEYMDSYLADPGRVSRKTGRPVEDSTVAGYRTISRLVARSLPDGSTPLSLAPGDVEGMIASMRDEGLSDVTIRKCFNALSSTLAHAVSHDGLASNPCEDVVPPRPGRPRHNALPADEADALAARLAGMEPTPAVTAAQVALCCGLRGGEIAALTLGDISTDQDGRPMRIHVHAALSLDARGRSTVKRPKTDAGDRVIPLSDESSAAVGRRMDRLREECMAPDRWPLPSLYLVGDADGRPTERALLSKQWTQVAHALDIRGLQGKYVSLHDLRHTFATYALSHGVPVKDVQYVLGHASASMTLDTYAQADPDMVAASLAAISRTVDT